MFERESWTFNPDLSQRKILIRDKDSEYDRFVETKGDNMRHLNSIEINMGAAIYEIWMEQYMQNQDEKLRERLYVLENMLHSCRIEIGEKFSKSETYCINEINKAIKSLKQST